MGVGCKSGVSFHICAPRTVSSERLVTTANFHIAQLCDMELSQCNTLVEQAHISSWHT